MYLLIIYSVSTCILRSIDCSCSRDIFSDPTFLQIDSVKAAFSNDFVDRSAYAGSDGFSSISISIGFGFMLKLKLNLVEFEI